MDNLKHDFWYNVGQDDMDDARMTHEQQQEALRKDRYNPKRINIDENMNAYRYDGNRNRIYL